ncbi:hypothetical protein CCMA1212_001780 [Trichoderma ghanense]|uniref:Uncharacterized protein n=1 Tax=Trichoderma ghanense TaxID=65468 RepID=A0ABY2HBG1_9HYPO
MQPGPPRPPGARNKAPNCCRHVGTQVWQRQMKAQGDVVHGGRADPDERHEVCILLPRRSVQSSAQSSVQSSLEAFAAKAY